MRNRIIAAGLFGYGALLGWAVTADHYSKKTREALAFKDALIDKQVLRVMQAESQVQEANLLRLRTESRLDETEKAYDELLDKAVSGTPDENQNEDPSVDKNDQADDEIPPGETPEQTRSNLQRLINKYVPTDEDAENFGEEAAREIERQAKFKPPYVISQGDYAFDDIGSEYAKITLTYYKRERILLDDEDEVVDVNELVGWRSLSSFGGDSGDPDTVFVRNERLETDFEVVQETEIRPPLHVQYGMPKEEYNVNRAAGLIRFGPEDL